MVTIRAFFPQNPGTFFSIFEKVQGKPLSPPLVTHLICDVSLVIPTFVSPSLKICVETYGN